MMYYLAIVLPLVFAQVLADTPVTQCDKGVLPTSVIVSNVGKEPCTTSPCPIDPSGSIEMYLNFTTPIYMESPYQQVYVDLLGMNYPFIDHDGCKNLQNTVCPLPEGEDVQYHFSMSLPSKLPEVTVGLRVYLQPDESTTEAAVCFGVSVKIVS
ncbi:uncharacterized protein LOC109596649 [Aethina tumida]|uniref:uncharacterized protein LOC109596649 n=1 Tax=Aethina tumida TaxID=116153 RepID=UPI002147A85B|nr:uncharacterized protein LOC109596649 [Aethina tumida]